MKVWMKNFDNCSGAMVAGMVAYAQSQSSSQQSGSDRWRMPARKAREDKKNAAKPKKVYTELMMSSLPRRRAAAAC